MKKNLPKKFIKKKAVVFEKKEKRAWKFPSIKRIIPEQLPQNFFSPKIFFLSFICGFLIMASVAEAYAIFQDQTILASVQKEQETMRREVTYWEQVVSIHKNYRDGYFKLALLAQQVGDKERAKKYIDKSLELDPDFAVGRQYQALLSR